MSASGAASPKDGAEPPGRVTVETTEIRDGIEHFVVRFPDGKGGVREEEDAQCARCGSTAVWVDCWNCDDGYSHHDCGEDTCCCLYPERNVRCDECLGRGGFWVCCSGREWCMANPMPGREGIMSTASDEDDR